jgi:hypothetical protein
MKSAHDPRVPRSSRSDSSRRRPLASAIRAPSSLRIPICIRNFAPGHGFARNGRMFGAPETIDDVDRPGHRRKIRIARFAENFGVIGSPGLSDNRIEQVFRGELASTSDNPTTATTANA